MNLKHDHPEYGWLAVVAMVVAADLTGHRTMSEVFRDTSKHPVAGPAIVLGWGVLTAHLFGLINPKYDPIHLISCNPRRCPHAGAR